MAGIKGIRNIKISGLNKGSGYKFQLWYHVGGQAAKVDRRVERLKQFESSSSPSRIRILQSPSSLPIPFLLSDGDGGVDFEGPAYS